MHAFIWPHNLIKWENLSNCKTSLSVRVRSSHSPVHITLWYHCANGRSQYSQIHTGTTRHDTRRYHTIRHDTSKYYIIIIVYCITHRPCTDTTWHGTIEHSNRECFVGLVCVCLNINLTRIEYIFIKY